MSLNVSFAAAALSTALAVVALLIAEHANLRRAPGLFKTLASLGFLWAAWAQGAWESAYGKVTSVGLCLCFWGDVLLIPKRRGWFLAGLTSFLVGHVVFAIAFVVRGVAWPSTVISAVILAGPAILVARWLRPHVDAGTRAPVLAYIVAITAMVAIAAGSFHHRASWTLAAGALGFYLSDLSVARDRFVAPAFVNRLWGLPLYYGAVLLLAASTAAR